MKKGFKIFVLIIGLMLAFVLIGMLGFRLYCHISSYIPPDPDDDYYVEEVDYINDKDVLILLCGSDIKFPNKELKWTPINVPDPDKIPTNHNYVYLILNDWDDSIDLSDDDCAELIKFADNNPWFSFLYLGKEKLHTFSELAHDEEGVRTGSLSFGYEFFQNSRIIHEGIWDEEAVSHFGEANPTLLGDNIIGTIYRTIASQE